MDRRKELKQQYKQIKPVMGIFIIQSKSSNKCYIEGTQNLRATLNATKFKLDAGAHPMKGLQKDWKEFGEENFIIEVLEYLEYDKDESKTDYTDDLALLKMEWEKKIAKENWVLYSKTS